jgi:hypothetical protein
VDLPGTDAYLYMPGAVGFDPLSAADADVGRVSAPDTDVYMPGTYRH